MSFINKIYTCALLTIVQPAAFAEEQPSVKLRSWFSGNWILGLLTCMPKSSLHQLRSTFSRSSLSKGSKSQGDEAEMQETDLDVSAGGGGRH